MENKLHRGENGKEKPQPTEYACVVPCLYPPINTQMVEINPNITVIKIYVNKPVLSIRIPDF